MNIFDTLFNHANVHFFLFARKPLFIDLYYTSFVCLCVDYKYKKNNQLLITAATEQEKHGRKTNLNNNENIQLQTTV